MPPVLHIMRHGQGYHTVASNGGDIRDPHLTGTGEQQARQQRSQFSRHDQVELLLASPLRRTLSTCAIAMLPCLDRGLQIIAVPHAMEACGNASDTGSDPELLKQEFADKYGRQSISFENVFDGWFKHEGEMALEPDALIRRAAKLRKWIKARPEKEVLLVAHGFFNHYLTGDVDLEGNQTTPWWDEAELRTFTFAEGHETSRPECQAYVGGEKGLVDGEDGAVLLETDQSLERLKTKEAKDAKVNGF